jgi:hypothetical protein
MATTLRPFRQYHENDVINLFAFDGTIDASNHVDAGSLVKIKATDTGTTPDTSYGWKHDQEFDLEDLTPYTNTVSDRWHVFAKVQLAGQGDIPIGMLLYGIREYDENGEKLIWHPRKYHEMQVALKGHAVPILTRGLVMLRGVDESQSGSPLIADSMVAAYAGTSGTVTTDPQTSGGVATNHKVGYFLGGKAGDNNDILMKLEL